MKVKIITTEKETNYDNFIALVSAKEFVMVIKDNDGFITVNKNNIVEIQVTN